MTTVYSTPAPAKIPSIDTIYKGYRFRSRLEARWAVFFDHLKLNWVYEHEGYALPSGWYLPDFYFPDENVFVEIKPGKCQRTAPHFDYEKDGVEHWTAPLSLPEQERMRELTKALDCGGIVFYGDPVDAAPGDPYDDTYFDCPHLCLIGRSGAWDLFGKMEGQMAAALAARQARFEHGERP